MRLTFADVSEGDRRKIFGENAAELYGFDLEALALRAKEHGPTPAQVNTPLPSEDIPRDSQCYLFRGALAELEAQASA